MTRIIIVLSVLTIFQLFMWLRVKRIEYVVKGSLEVIAEVVSEVAEAARKVKDGEI